MRKYFFLFFVLMMCFPSFAAEETKSVTEYMKEDFPYEFVARRNPGYVEQMDYNSNSEFLKAGVDIWFKPHWRWLPTSYEYRIVQSIDSIIGNRFFISVHVDYQLLKKEQEKEPLFYGISNESATLLGRLDAKDYLIVLTIVDDSGELNLTPFEVPFTVKENPVTVPNGLVHVGKGMDFIGDNEGKLRFADEDYRPCLTLTAEDNDSLHVEGWLNYTCCMDHYCYYEIHGDSVYLETVQAGYFEKCDCNALHPVDFKIGPYKTTSTCAIGTWEYYLGAHAQRLDVTTVPSMKSDDILSDEKPFDLQGRPVDGTQRGILIRNGKKMLVK